jgi:O-antigen/teichoic acid export membrane protein
MTQLAPDKLPPNILQESMNLDSSMILSSVKWNYIGAIIKAISQIAIMALLARMLTPNEFGLMAIGLIVIRFGKYFSDLGTSAALVQKKDINKDDIAASFLISALLGFVFFLLFFVVAAPLSVYFKNDQVKSIIKLLSIFFLFSGLSLTSQSVLKRALDFKTISIIEVISYVMSYGIIGVSLALLHFGVYSLVLAFLAQNFLIMLLVIYKAKPCLKMPRVINRYTGLLAYGGKYSWHTFLCYIGSNLDQIVIGRSFSKDLLGYYNRGKTLVQLPLYQVLISVSAVLFPSYARLQDDKGRLKSLFMKGFVLLGIIIVPISFGMIPAGRAIIGVFLGEQWTKSIVIFQVCCLFIPIDFMTSIIATLCSATNKLKQQIMLESLFIIILTMGIIFAVRTQDIVLIAGIVGIGYFLRLFAYLFLIRQVLALSLKDAYNLFVPQLASSLSVFFGVLIITRLLGSLSIWLMLPIQVVTGLIFLYLTVSFAPFEYLDQAIREVLIRYEKKIEKYAIIRALVEPVRKSGEIAPFFRY